VNLFQVAFYDFIVFIVHRTQIALSFLSGWRRYGKMFSKSNVTVKNTELENSSGNHGDIDQPDSIVQSLIQVDANVQSTVTKPASTRDVLKERLEKNLLRPLANSNRSANTEATINRRITRSYRKNQEVELTRLNFERFPFICHTQLYSNILW